MTDSNTNSNEIFELPLKSESPSYRLRTIDEVGLSFWVMRMLDQISIEAEIYLAYSFRERRVLPLSSVPVTRLRFIWMWQFKLVHML